MEIPRCHLHSLLVFALVAAVNSQSYPRFEMRGDVLVIIVRVNIGEGHNDSLHCVTDNSDCCSCSKTTVWNPLRVNMCAVHSHPQYVVVDSVS